MILKHDIKKYLHSKSHQNYGVLTVKQCRRHIIQLHCILADTRINLLSNVLGTVKIYDVALLGLISQHYV